MKSPATPAVRADLSVHAIVYLAGALALAMAVGLPASARPWAAVLGSGALAVTLEFGAKSLPLVIRRFGQAAGAAIAVLALAKMFDPRWVVAGAGVVALGVATNWFLHRPVAAKYSRWSAVGRTAVSAVALVAMPIGALVVVDRFGWLGHDLAASAVLLGLVGLVQTASSRLTGSTWAPLAALLGFQHALVGVVFAGIMAAGSTTDSRWAFPACAALLALASLVTTPAHRSEIVSVLGIAAAVVGLVEATLVFGWINRLAAAGPAVLWILGAAVVVLAIDLLRGGHHGRHRHHAS